MLCSYQLLWCVAKLQQPCQIRCTSKFSVQFCDLQQLRISSTGTALTTDHCTKVHNPLSRNPRTKTPKVQPKTQTKSTQNLSAQNSRSSFCTTHALALALRLPSHTPAASSFLTALVVVYTPIMLGSAAFTASFTHTNTPRTFASTHRRRLAAGWWRKSQDHLAAAAVTTSAHTHTNTTMIEHSPPQPRRLPRRELAAERN